MWLGKIETVGSWGQWALDENVYAELYRDVNGWGVAVVALSQ